MHTNELTIRGAINKDTQILDGTKGFSTKKGAAVEYYLSAGYRAASCIQCLHQMTNG